MTMERGRGSAGHAPSITSRRVVRIDDVQQRAAPRGGFGDMGMKSSRGECLREAPCPGWRPDAAGVRRGRGAGGGLIRLGARVALPKTRSATLSRRFRRSTPRSEEHTSDLQSLMRTSYAVFCLTKKNIKDDTKK